MADRLPASQRQLLEVLRDAAAQNAVLNEEALIAVLCARRCVAYSPSQAGGIRAALTRLERLGMVFREHTIVRLRPAGEEAIS